MGPRQYLEHDEDARSAVEVTLDILSGRPNPKWSLSDEQVRELKDRLLDIPRAKPSRPIGLGYRGVVVMNHARDPKLPSQIRAYDSVLSVSGAGGTTYHKDVNRIEEWLLDQAKALGYADLIEHFRKQKHSTSS